MLRLLARNWWGVALRGLFAVIFGILAFIWPETTVVALAILFGAYALVDGIFALIAAVKDRSAYGRWWLLLLEGLIGIGVGILTFIWPNITAFVLLYMIAAWAILTGVLEIVLAIALRKELEGEWLLVVSGIASVLFGIALMIWPGAGAVTLVWLIGGFAITFGILMIILGFRLRGWQDALRRSSPRTV